MCADVPELCPQASLPDPWDVGVQTLVPNSLHVYTSEVRTEVHFGNLVVETLLQRPWQVVVPIEHGVLRVNLLGLCDAGIRASEHECQHSRGCVDVCLSPWVALACGRKSRAS